MPNVPLMNVPVPSVEELGLDQYTICGKPFNDLLAERQQLKQLKDDADIRIAEIDSEVGAAMDLKGVKNALWRGEYLVIRREASKPRPILDRSLLLNAGVTPLQLQAGTKLGQPGKSGVTVRSIAKDKVVSTEENGNDPGEFSFHPI